MLQQLLDNAVLENYKSRDHQRAIEIENTRFMCILANALVEDNPSLYMAGMQVDFRPEYSYMTFSYFVDDFSLVIPTQQLLEGFLGEPEDKTESACRTLTFLVKEPKKFVPDYDGWNWFKFYFRFYLKDTAKCEIYQLGTEIKTYEVPIYDHRCREE